MKMNKHLIIALFTLLTYTGTAQEKIHWMSWDEMIQQREKDSVKKKIFIDFYTGWCGWCKKMDKSTFLDPTVVSYMNSNYYAVKFDAETRDTIVFNNTMFTNTDPNFVKSSPRSRGKTHWFAYSLLDGQLSYPSYVILDENFVRVTIIKGYKNQEALLANLLFFAKQEYKYYHNYLNELWRKSLQKQQAEQAKGDK